MSKINTLVWCSPHPNHYNSYMFDHIQTIKGLEFKAVYFKKTLAGYPWKTEVQSSYPVYYLNNKLGVDMGLISSVLFKRGVMPVVAGWNNPTMILLLTLLRITGKKYIICSDTPKKKERKGFSGWLRRAWLQFILNGAYHYFVTGKIGVARVQELFKIEISKLKNFPFATNIDYFTPGTEGHPSTFVTLISSGRLVISHKGYDVAIKGLGLFKKKHPDVTFRYYIAGEGRDRAQVEALILENNLTEEVILKGWLEASELLSFYHSGDIFLHPAYEDPFPNAVLEAMACGLPVVGSDTAGSVVDRIQNGYNGYVFESGNVESFYEAVQKMICASNEARSEMGEKARKTAEQHSVANNIVIIKSVLKLTE